MKRLFLLRHAEAANDSAIDSERKLTDAGILKCQEISANLRNYIADIDLILSSNSVRTRETIENTLENLDIKKPKLYYTSDLYNCLESDLLQYLQYFEQRLGMVANNIILVNHNPAISHLTNFLSQNSINSPYYPEVVKGFSPGSLALFKANIKSWNELDSHNILLENFWR